MAEVTSCEPADLVAAAKCMSCIPPSMQKPVEIYLLMQIAGMDMTAAELVAAAKCYACIPPSMRDAVLAYLDCTIATA